MPAGWGATSRCAACRWWSSTPMGDCRASRAATGKATRNITRARAPHAPRTSPIRNARCLASDSDDARLGEVFDLVRCEAELGEDFGGVFADGRRMPVD